MLVSHITEIFFIGYCLVEDIKLNSTVFHWPEYIQSVFDISNTRIATKCENLEADLKKRLSTFEEKLSIYMKDVEIFKKKEVNALSILIVIYLIFLNNLTLFLLFMFYFSVIFFYVAIFVFHVDTLFVFYLNISISFT